MALRTMSIEETAMKRMYEQFEQQAFCAYYVPRPWWCIESQMLRQMSTSDYVDPRRYFSIFFPKLSGF